MKENECADILCVEGTKIQLNGEDEENSEAEMLSGKRESVIKI